MTPKNLIVCDGTAAVTDNSSIKPSSNNRLLNQRAKSPASSSGENAGGVYERRDSGDSVSALNRISKAGCGNSREEDLRNRARTLLAEFTKDHKEKGREPTPEEDDSRKRQLRERARLLISEAKQQSDSGGVIRISETLNDSTFANRPQTLVTPRGAYSAPHTRENTPDSKLLGANVNFYQFRSKPGSSETGVPRSTDSISKRQRMSAQVSQESGIIRPELPALGGAATKLGKVMAAAENGSASDSPSKEPIKICIGERIPGAQSGSSNHQPKELAGSILSTPLRRQPVIQSVSVIGAQEDPFQEPIKTTAWEIVQELEDVAAKQEELDKRATEVEKKWRRVMQEAQGSEEEQQLMNEFLRLLNERNLLTRRDLHLSLLEKIHDYEQRFHLVQQELGNLIQIEEGEKTESHKQRIDRLMEELINIVNKRDELVQQLMANEHEAEEDSALGQDVLQGSGKLPPVQDDKNCVIQ